MPKKYRDPSWDFKTANTKEYTHCYHNYPAMMIPQVADRLISSYGNRAKTLLDPYCGTGTSLVAATLKGINAIGCDLNPMARLIALAKTSIIDLQILEQYLKAFNDFLRSSDLEIVYPDFKNIDFWFKQDSKIKLSIVKQFIKTIKDESVQNFFLVAFSETVRESSLTRNSEFKLYRMPEEQREKFNPDVFKLMNTKLARNQIGLKQYLAAYKAPVEVAIYALDATEKIDQIATESIDLVVTSPPYGDSKTTVAYGQFSRLSNQWLDIESANQIDNQLMGGKRRDIKHTGLKVIDTAVRAVAEKDTKRAREIYSFYEDYAASIKNVAKLIKKKGYACYVVGNRTVKDIVLPTDNITQCLFQEYGFKHQNTFIRDIPNKRMPSKNSPTNKIGKTATTMNNEYIVIMQKQ